MISCQYNLETCRAALPFEALELSSGISRPDFWRVRVEEIIDECRAAAKGKSDIICHTPAGYPVYAVFYGDFSEVPARTNWSSGSAVGNRKHLRQADAPQTILLLAGIHGAEAESVAALVNLIHLLETGKDYRGIFRPEWLEFSKNYRFIIVPCANMDGRAICPDHLMDVGYEDFRAASQGRWLDGSLIGYGENGTKSYFPLPLEQVSFPGGYTNSAGYNIMHDASPGEFHTSEAAALVKLVSRWSVDFVLNCHSCEFEPIMLAPTEVNYQCNIDRGLKICMEVNQALFKSGLRSNPGNGGKVRPIVNINNLFTLASGALALTFESAVTLATFEQVMEATFVAAETILRSGLKEPYGYRLAGK